MCLRVAGWPSADRRRTGLWCVWSGAPADFRPRRKPLGGGVVRDSSVDIADETLIAAAREES